MRTLAPAASLVVVALTGGTSFGATMIAETTYGSHSYELWAEAGISWDAARLEAISAGGHLATLTSLAETQNVYEGLIGNGFFTANSGQQFQAWLGGYTTAPNNSTSDANAWAWVTGEEWNSFAAGNFFTGEPNGDSSGLSINRFGTWQWNDESGLVGGFIVERSVPEAGSSLMLMGAAVAFLGAIRRKFRS